MYQPPVFCERRCIHVNGEWGGGMCAEALAVCCVEQQVVFTFIFSFSSDLILLDHPYSVSDLNNYEVNVRVCILKTL
jgi:hypothetical protein